MSEPQDQHNQQPSGESDGPRPAGPSQPGSTPPPAEGQGGRPPVRHQRPAPPPPPPGGQPIIYAAPPQRSWINKILTVLLVFSLLLNLYLGSLVSMMMRGDDGVLIEGDPNSEIAIIPIDGVITDDTYRFVRHVLRQLEQASTPPRVVILRINSGGGAVGASDRIWHSLKTFRSTTNIPIIASYGSVAASGAYYISAQADHILAEPTAITGSIGVMANVVTIDQLLAKIGVTPEVHVAQGSPRKSIANDITRPWDEEDRRVLQFVLDSAHERFVEVVAEGRETHLALEEIASLADGSFYTASQAVENKLIDEIGYLDDAIAHAAQLANLTNPHVVVYGPRRSLVEVLLGSGTPPAPSASAPSATLPDLSQLDAAQLRRLLIELATPHLEYRCSVVAP